MISAPALKRLQPASVVWRETRSYFWAFRWRLGVGLALIVIDRAASLVLPASSKFLVDEVLSKGRHDLLLPLAIAILAAAALRAGTSFAVARILSFAAQRVVTDLRQQIQQHVLRLPVSDFDAEKSGSLVSRIMKDPEGIRNLVGTGLVNLVGSLVTAVAALAVLIWLDWRLTVVVAGLMSLFAGIVAWSFAHLRPLYRKRNRIVAEMTGRLTEVLSGIRIVKVYTAEKREDRAFARDTHRLLRNTSRTIDAHAIVSAMSTVLVGLVGGVLLFFGGRAVVEGRMTLGDLVTYVFFTGMLSSPLRQITALSASVNEAFAGLDRLRELRLRETENALQDQEEAPRHLEGIVTFDSVSFAYRPGHPVLHDVDFSVPAGATVALVGPSGAGKTTVLSLVAGFHHPTSGTVRVDGHDLQNLRSRDYRRHLGIVLQDNFLFDGTVADNIAYCRPSASREEIEHVARIAHVDAFACDLPEGFDTVVGERGIRLSGGQKQRVAIARAILADPAILLLDEATSSLDSESEALIQDGLARLRSGRTSFVIAHRLSTIESADLILVLDNGRIVERGSHDELIEQGGRYRAMHDRQRRSSTASRPVSIRAQ